jgi:tRNA 2-thiouridine synthesizing protein A
MVLGAAEGWWQEVDSSMEGDATLDCVGLYCPMPIIQTKAKMEELEVGDVLEVVADDKGIEADMPAWCRSTGNEFLGLEEEDGEYRVYVRKLKT